MLSIIIVNYNGEAIITRCIASLKTYVGVDSEIIVVDNNSSDRSIAVISAAHPDVRLIRSDENIGFGKANNLAVEKASYSNLLLVNSDCFLVENISSLIKRHFAKSNSMGSCRVVSPNGDLQYTMGKDIHPLLYSITWLPVIGKRISLTVTNDAMYYVESAPEWLCGVFLMLKKQDFLDVGGFDPDYFMYMEDLDLCRTLRAKKSVVCCYYSNFKVMHLGMGGDKKKRASAVINSTNSYIVFFNKYYHKRVARMALLMLSMVFTIRFVLELPISLQHGDRSYLAFPKAIKKIFAAL